MRYLKKYKKFNEELFGLFKKEDEGKDWKSKLEWLFNNYKSKSVKYLNAEIEKSTTSGECLSISWSTKQNNNHYTIFDNVGTKDGKNRVAITLKDVNEWPVITDEEYQRYREKVKEISDYLDDKEDISSSSIGPGEIDLDIDENEINQMLANDEIKKVFKSYLNKEYQFEAEFHEWTGPHDNEKKIEDIKLTIYDVTGNVRPSGKGGKPDFYLKFRCKLGDRKMSFMIDESNTTDYIPIKDIPYKDKYSLTISLYKDEEGLNRKEIRKLKEHGYPYVINYDMVPSDWNAIELMKECKNIIDSINSSLNKKD